MTFSQFIVGFIGIPLGIVIIYYRVPIKDFVGNVGFAERYLGKGGTWTLVVSLGLAVSIFSLMWMFGVPQEWFVENLGPFFGVSSNS